MCDICNGVLTPPCECDKRFYVCVLNEEKTGSKVVGRYELLPDAIRFAVARSKADTTKHYLLTKGKTEFNRIIHNGSGTVKRPITLKTLW